MAEFIPLDRFLRLLADESVPVVHRALWALLWESDVRVLDLLALDVSAEPRIRPPADGDLGGLAAALLGRLAGDRTSGPLFAVGPRALSWDEAVRTAQAGGVAIHAIRTSGRQHRGRR
ncbi:hypothetical protein [Streptomyces sp. MP131-18]|uniref:hypothetical protein n=1 Tax=Streptomyces sp. MP131-18 TaxID=1857892 RepID=UPI0009D15822|nr:hypothetical protein [Streptomyces sp. MP131-18]ONK11478.1 hypothetical protein STBA_22110 [Streptomyces sp. MP131-18]